MTIDQTRKPRAMHVIDSGATATSGDIRGSGLLDCLTFKEVAAALRLPLPTVYYMHQKGRLPAVKHGRRWLVPSAWVHRYLSGFAARVAEEVVRVEAEQRSQVECQCTDVLPGKACPDCGQIALI